MNNIDERVNLLEKLIEDEITVILGRIDKNAS